MRYARDRGIHFYGACSNRLIERSKYSLLLSIPIKRLPNSLQTTPVVELPVKGSTTRSPGKVEARRIRRNKERGFWVGCPPHVFHLVLSY